MSQIIGFIGLGIMGRPMSKHLLKGGHSLVVYDILKEPVKELVSLGAKEVGSPADVARATKLLITMLPSSPQVEEVALGPGGLVEGIQAGTIYADMSTISPIVSQKVEKVLAPKGVKMLDAPVSGGEKGAIEAVLSIMVGGEKEAFDHFLPLFQLMGKTITHMGPIGAGGFTKLANQIMVAINLTGIAEALVLGTKAGLDLDLMIRALAGGLAGSRCLDQKTPNYLAHDFKPGFKIDFHYKDLGLIMEAARALGVPVPITALVQELFNAARVKGRGGMDHSGIITILEEMAGVRVGKK